MATKKLDDIVNYDTINSDLSTNKANRSAAEKALQNKQQTGFIQSDGTNKLENNWNTAYNQYTTTVNKGQQNSALTNNYLKKMQAAEKAWDNRPDYVSPYSEQIQALLDQIMNQKEFQYDLNADPLYQQYKNQYTRLGQNAMLDTMANAAALSGGYGNSYASTAGNQAYQNYLNELNNVVPELYQQAYGKYRDDIAEQYNQMGLLQGMDNTEYGRHRDNISDLYNTLGYYSGRYDTEWGKDFDTHRAKVSDLANIANLAYGAFTDSKNFDYNQFRDDMGDLYTNLDYYNGNVNNLQGLAMDLAQHLSSEEQRELDNAYRQDQFNWQKEVDQRDHDYRVQQDALNLAMRSSGGSGGGGGGSPRGSNPGSGSNLSNYISKLDGLQKKGSSAADLVRAIDGYNISAEDKMELLGMYGLTDTYNKLMNQGNYPTSIQGLIRAYGADYVYGQGIQPLNEREFEEKRQANKQNKSIGKSMVNWNGTWFADYQSYEKAYVDWWLNKTGKTA